MTTPTLAALLAPVFATPLLRRLTTPRWALGVISCSASEDDDATPRALTARIVTRRRETLGYRQRELVMSVAGLPEDCVATYRVYALDGRLVASGAVCNGEATAIVRLPVGTYRLQWAPVRAAVAGVTGAFAPTVLERTVRLPDERTPVDGSATYVWVRRIGE